MKNSKSKLNLVDVFCQHFLNFISNNKTQNIKKKYFTILNKRFLQEKRSILTRLLSKKNEVSQYHS